MKIKVILRWLLAAGIFCFAVASFYEAFRIGGLGAAGGLIIGFGGLIAGVLLISPEVILPILDRISRIFTDVVLPSDRFSKPTLSYVLARRYRQQLRFREASEEYQKIIYYYPNEKTAYQELLVMARELDAAEVYHKYADLYLKRFGHAFDETLLPRP